MNVQPPTWFGIDVSCWILPALRALLSISGRKVETLGPWQHVLQRFEERELKSPTQQFMRVIKLLYKYRTGETLSVMETHKVFEETQIPTLKAMAKIYYGISLIEGCKAKEDQMGGLQVALSAEQDMVKAWGEENGKLLVDGAILVRFHF